jgi:photosynthetic reaction center H subunit
MQTGSLTSYIDVAQITLYAFWIFFAGLIFYLRTEDKREGYPLESERSSRVLVQGFPPIPSPKTFLLPHGGTVSAPSGTADTREVRAEPIAAWLGAPLEPVGRPMLDGVGPAAYAARADVPELTVEGEPSIVPMRVATDTSVAAEDVSPIGMEVVGADRQVAGIVRDIWIDRVEPQIRYLEVELPAQAQAQPAAAPRRVLLPITLARISARSKQVRVKSILARQFADVPALKNPDQVTKLEEDRIAAYYAGGNLYATPARLGPVL